MHTRKKACSNDGDDRRRGQNFDVARLGATHSIAVGAGAPGNERIVPHHARDGIAGDDIRAVWKRRNRGANGAFRTTVEPLGVQRRVNRIGSGSFSETRLPQRGKPFVVCVPAFGTRPVPGGERGRFVEKE